MFDVPSCDYTLIVLPFYLTFPATPGNRTSASHPEVFWSEGLFVRLLTVLEISFLNSIDLLRYM